MLPQHCNYHLELDTGKRSQKFSLAAFKSTQTPSLVTFSNSSNKPGPVMASIDNFWFKELSHNLQSPLLIHSLSLDILKTESALRFSHISLNYSAQLPLL